MDRLNVCVVGCGDIFERSHAEHWERNPHSRIHSVVDLDPERAQAAAARTQASRWLTDFEEAYADPTIDAVDIALPHQLHARATIAACRAGKPVLCEKPMAMRVAEAAAMCEAAEAAGVPLSIRHTMRYEPVYQEMKRRIEAGDIGVPHYAAIQCGGLIPNERLASLPYWRWFRHRGDGGGAIAGVGVHGVDLLLWLTSGTVVAAYGVGGRRMLAAGFGPEVDVEDTAALVVGLEGGGVLQVTATWTLRGRRPPAEVQGSEGALFAEGPELTLVGADNNARSLPVPPVERTITDDFVEALRGNGPLPAPGRQVLESVKVLEACYRTIDPLR